MTSDLINKACWASTKHEQAASLVSTAVLKGEIIAGHSPILGEQQAVTCGPVPVSALNP